MGGILGSSWCNLNASESTWLYVSYFLDHLTLIFLGWKYISLYIYILIDLCNGETKGVCEQLKNPTYVV